MTALAEKPAPLPLVLELLAEWLPRERLGGAQWAELERVLSREESPEPGPWRSIPWQREILDAFADDQLDWIVILKGAQMGVSELVRCAIGRWALLDPGDVLWVMTTEDAAEKAMRKLRAMFRATPSLRHLISPKRSDSRLKEMILTNGMKIVIGWAGSSQSLSSDPFRRVVLDEAAKYKWAVQGESNPVDFAKERTKVFGRRGKIILLSSPKHDDDIICTNHAHLTDRRVFGVPCPKCSTVQGCDWSRVRWPDGDPETAPKEPLTRAKLADLIEAAQSAWLECRTCGGEIQPHLAQWNEGAGWIDDDGAERGGRRRGFHIGEFHHWKTTLSDLVGKWLRCARPSAIQGFWNGSLGLPKKSIVGSEIRAELFEARAIHPKGVVPAWATTVIATADTQLRGWWYVVRAWASGDRSRLLDWGWVESEDALLAATLGARFPVEGRPQEEAKAHLLAIDSGGGMERPDGSRTKDVYKLVRKTRRSVAIKGEGDREANQGKPWSQSSVRISKDKPDEVDLFLINKNYYADELASLLACTDPVKWEECKGAENKTYMRQMASMQRVEESGPRGTKTLWKKKSQGSQNHLHDCSRYQVWAAEYVRVEDRSSPTWTIERVRPAREERSGGGYQIGRDF